jgi:hypothetical protein
VFEHPGASVSSLHLSERGYVGFGPREERDVGAAASQRASAISYRAVFDARA